MALKAPEPILLFIVGPTASGKTAIAISIAEKLGAEIISADSVQFYDELKIGSARPSEEELGRVRHHLVGHISVSQDYTAGDFEREAMGIIKSHPEKSYLVVGGSGFYIQALEKGMYPTDRASEARQIRLEDRADTEGLTVLHKELTRRDPETARKIAVQDRYRIIRALDILEGLPKEQTLSQMREDFEREAKLRFPGRRVATLGLRIERARLEPRVIQRTRAMMGSGFLDEVRGLKASGLAERPALQSVGYKEVLQFLAGEILEPELEPLIVQGTLRLAKKQRTWFARSAETHWFDAETEREAAVTWATDWARLACTLLVD